MESNIVCLRQACARKGLDVQEIDKEGNFIRVRMHNGYEYFQLNRTPFNAEVVYGICQDKMHTYELLHESVRMPHTASFLDWKVDQKYLKYLTYSSEQAVIEEIERSFTYPVVVKKNRGALGENVFLCHDTEELEQALGSVFNPESKGYDYIALVQEFVSTSEEYRLVCAFGHPVLLYRRGKGGRDFNLRYWEQGEIAELLEDDALTRLLRQFVQPVFDVIKIGFAGFDIIRGNDGHLYLIEINASPKFDHVTESSGNEPVVEMYEQCLTLFEAR